MKEQMKSNLFISVLGCLVLGIFLMSNTDKETASAAMQVPILQEQPSIAPAPEPTVEASPKIPFTFYLTLLTSFTNGASIDFNAMDSGENSSIWDKISKWREEH